VFSVNGFLTILFLLLALSVIAAIIPFYLVPRVIRKASEWGVLDHPDERKAHIIPTPRLGGLSIMPSLWLGCSVALLLASVFSLRILAPEVPVFLNAVLGLLIGCTGIFLLGCLDDFKRLTAGQKLATEAAIVALTLNFLPLPSLILGIPVDPFLVSVLIFGWLLIIPNSVNLLDGIDGLTASISSLFLATCSVLAIFRGEMGWLLILVPALASTLSFLKFNWRPARIFLGDSGSLLLGFAVAYLSLMFAMSPKGDSGHSWNIFISLLLTSVWLLDTLLAITRRYWDKRPTLKVFFRRSRGKYLALQGEAFANIVRPDRKHLHHKLVDIGFSSSQTVYIICTIAAGSMLSALGFSISGVSFWSLPWMSIAIIGAALSLLGLIGVGILYRRRVVANEVFVNVRPMQRPKVRRAA